MSAIPNIASSTFVAEMGEEIVVAQVWIHRTSHGFELRHIDDRTAGTEKLTQVQLGELRRIATFTATEAFRPLKSAPNLQSGWVLFVSSEAELERALNQLYPGAMADWHAARALDPPLTSWREFTLRQTGMYRITQKLTDEESARVIRTACHPRFCLKRRLWTSPHTPSEAASEKSIVPCLEPCAMLLELARKAMRIQQEETILVELSPSELRTVVSELESSLDAPERHLCREADLQDARNPRRVQLLLEKLREHLSRARSASQTSDPD